MPVYPFLLAALRGGRARRTCLDGISVYFPPYDHGERQPRARQTRLAERLAVGLEAVPRPDVIITA